MVSGKYLSPTRMKKESCGSFHKLVNRFCITKSQREKLVRYLIWESLSNSLGVCCLSTTRPLQPSDVKYFILSENNCVLAYATLAVPIASPAFGIVKI